jgi:hypothetical protein
MRAIRSSWVRVSGRWACAVAAGFALAAGAHAASVAVVESATVVPVETVAVVPVETVIVTENVGRMTRAEVKEAYRSAKRTNRLTPNGEIGDTREVLMARNEFNRLQAEVLAQHRVLVPERVSVLTDQERRALEAMLDENPQMTLLVLDDER